MTDKVIVNGIYTRVVPLGSNTYKAKREGLYRVQSADSTGQVLLYPIGGGVCSAISFEKFRDTFVRASPEDLDDVFRLRPQLISWDSFPQVSIPNSEGDIDPGIADAMDVAIPCVMSQRGWNGWPVPYFSDKWLRIMWKIGCSAEHYSQLNFSLELDEADNPKTCCWFYDPNVDCGTDNGVTYMLRTQYGDDETYFSPDGWMWNSVNLEEDFDKYIPYYAALTLVHAMQGPLAADAIMAANVIHTADADSVALSREFEDVLTDYFHIPEAHKHSADEMLIQLDNYGRLNSWILNHGRPAQIPELKFYLRNFMFRWERYEAIS